MAKQKRPVVRGRKPGTGRPRRRDTFSPEPYKQSRATVAPRRGGTNAGRPVGSRFGPYEELVQRVPASVRREVASYYSDVTNLPSAAQRLYDQYSPFASAPPKSARGVAKPMPNVTSSGGFRTRRMR